MRILSDMRAAFALLTVVPGSRDADVPTSGMTPWFPWVGAVLGIVTVAPLFVLHEETASGAGSVVTRGALTLAVALLLAQGLLTRLLHIDGLADVADGFWGGADVRRRLDIMADSATGAFGTAAVVFAVVAMAVSLGAVLESGERIWLLAIVPLLGRCAAMFGAWFGRPARPGGLGARVIGPPNAAGVFIALIALAGAGVLSFSIAGREGALWFAACTFAALSIPHLTSERFGGVTGDVLGSSVVLTEVA
ncbi:MAG: adenosylcobinamide-GDP ribazoletransferase, partial [Actinomycetota bacterium]|nr:adenosylcobinamide-GDP ribazoletransferase [Actinomycetota bacterium]